MSDAAEKIYQVMSGNDFKNELALTGDDIERVVGHLSKVQDVISKVLKEGSDGAGDYGIVPGTSGKKALYKAGSEKLMKLFGLGVRFELVDKEMDRYENYASFSYRADVYHLKSGITLASCEGTSSSWEKKYKERAVYVNKVYTGKEPTPVCDILNTLKKMAQKRAMVGAVIIATAASDYFTQDEDEIENQKPVNKEIQKTDASRFHGPSASDPGDYVAPVGKFKGKKLREIPAKELSGYVEYMALSPNKIEGQLKEFIDRSREHLRSVKE